MLKKILFVLFAFTLLVKPQGKNILLFGGKNFYLWNAVTGSNLVTDTDVFLYGSFTKTKVPKDSLDDFGSGLVRAGTTSASKYMAYYLPGELNHQTINRTFESGTGLDWILSNPAAIITSEFAHSGTKSLKFGVLDGVTNFSILHRDSTIAESNQWYLFDFWIKSDAGATATFTMYTTVGVPRNFTPIDTNWAHIQISSYASTYPYIYIHKSSGTNGDYYIDDFSITHLPDSVRTLARSISLDDLVEDTVYTYYTSVLQPNGRYSKGAVETFQTLFEAPYLAVDEPDTLQINLNVLDFTKKVDTFFIYRADTIGAVYALYDTITTSGIWSDNVDRGYAYKVLAKATYSSVYAETPTGLNEVYAEPILPYIPDFVAPSNLVATDDTTGIKLTWLKGTEDVIIEKKIIALETWASLDTVASNAEEYCDSIPDLTANRTYMYRLYSFNGFDLEYSNTDTATAIYAAQDSTVTDSSVVSIDTTGWVYTDSSATVDTVITGGSGFTPSLLSLTGANTSDFYYQTGFGTVNTFSIVDGTYQIAYNSTGSQFTDNQYGRRDFTAQSDSVFVGFHVILNSLVDSSAQGLHGICNIMDSVNAQYISLALDDSDANDTFDSWSLRLIGITAVTLTGTIQSGNEHRLQFRWVKNGTSTGVIQLYDNDVLVISSTNRTWGATAPMAVDIGTNSTSSNNSWSYSKNVKYDNIYVDNDSVRYGEWWNASADTSYDTTWTYTDSTAITDTTWGVPYTYSYTLVDFDCAYNEVVDTTQVSGLSVITTSSSSATIAWNSIPNVSGYKVERKVDQLSEATYSQIANITQPLDSADYTNTGNNKTGWTQTSETGNDVVITSTGGNPDTCLVFDWGGTNDQLYLASSTLGSLPYTPEFWLSADVYISPNFSIGNLATSRVLTLFYSGVASPQLVLNAYATSGTYIDGWRIQNTGASDIYTSTGLPLGQWKTIIMGINFTTGNAVIWSDNDLVASYTDETFTGTSITGVRLGTNGTGTIPDASSYWKYDNIKFAPDSAGLFGTTAKPDTTYLDSPLSPSTTYVYRIRAYNDLGNYPYSDTLEVTTNALTVNPITNLDTTDVGSNYTKFSFTESTSPEVDSTRFIWGIQNGLSTSIKWVVAGTDTFGLYGLTESVNYEITGQAYDYATNTYSTATSTLSWQTIPPPPNPDVAPPTSFAYSSKGTTSITYTYVESDTPDADHYIYWKVESNPTYEDSQLVVSSPITLSGLNSGTSYSAYMSAWKNGLQSPLTTTVTQATNNMPASGNWTFDYYVSSLATTGGNDGTFANPFTLREAISIAQAGDTVFVDKGQYDINATTGSVLTFSNSGTPSNPIVFRGEYDGNNPKTVNGTASTYLKCAHTTNGNIKINGDYIKFYNMVIEQSVNTNGGVQQAINVSGDYVSIDSCVIREPSGISGEHTIVVKPSAQHFALRNSYLWNSGRTFIWIEASATDAASYSLMENNTFTGMDNHYAFQIMPLTNVSNPPNNLGAIVRNNLFIDIPYSSAVYLRNTQDFKIYNNVFIRAGGYYGSPINIQTHESAPYDTLDANGLVAYNTYIADTYAGGAQEFVHHYGNMNNVKLYNNLCVFSSVKYVYRTGYTYNTIAAGYRWKSDYNLFYAVDDPNWTGTKNSVWYNPTGSGEVTYNWANTKSVLGFDANTIVGQLPLFVNAGAGDYRLQAASRGVGEGIDLSSWGITTDKDGNPRDESTPTIGAFEYVP